MRDGRATPLPDICSPYTTLKFLTIYILFLCYRNRGFDDDTDNTAYLLPVTFQQRALLNVNMSRNNLSIMSTNMYMASVLLSFRLSDCEWNVRSPQQYSWLWEQHPKLNNDPIDLIEDRKISTEGASSQSMMGSKRENNNNPPPPPTTPITSAVVFAAVRGAIAPFSIPWGIPVSIYDKVYRPCTGPEWPRMLITRPRANDANIMTRLFTAEAVWLTASYMEHVQPCYIMITKIRYYFNHGRRFLYAAVSTLLQ